MTQENITYITGASFVNCVVPLGKAEAVLKAARDLGVGAGIVYHGRGTGLRERLGILGIAVETEKEIVMIMVANERLDTIIEGLFKAAEMDSLIGGGYIYAVPVDKAAMYIPEEALSQVQST